MHNRSIMSLLITGVLVFAFRCGNQRASFQSVVPVATGGGGVGEEEGKPKF